MFEPDLLFVYGTLRRGRARHGVLRKLGARYVGRGSIQAELFDLGNFPGARRTEAPSARVVGEIYRLRNPARSSKTLDEVEGVGSAAPAAGLFRREITVVTLENGKQVRAWVYWVNRVPGARRRIASGDYVKSRSKDEGGRRKAECRLHVRPRG